MIVKAIFAGASVALLTLGRASATTYAYSTLDVPGSTDTFSVGINVSGAATGSYSAGSRELGFVYSDGTYTTLNFPRSSDTLGTGITIMAL